MYVALPEKSSDDVSMQFSHCVYQGQHRQIIMSTKGGLLPGGTM